MRKFYRIISLIIACISVVSLAACNKSGETETTDIGTVETGADGFDANGFVIDDLPSDLELDQEEVTLLHWNAPYQEFFADEYSGALVGDSIYKRNLTVESRLGIKLLFVQKDGNNVNLANFVSCIQADVMSGLREFDIIAGYSQTMAAVCNSGYLLNLKTDSSYLNFEKPWWPTSLVNEATIGNKLYFVSGDISTNLLYGMSVVYFNKNTLKQYGIDEPYYLVYENQWTLEKMNELAKSAYRDLDSVEGRSKGDAFGQVVGLIDTDAFFYGSGLRTTSKNNKGEMVVSDTFFSEKADALCATLQSMFVNSEHGFFELGPDVFGAERAMFFIGTAADAMNTFVNEDVEYGIMPAPLYDSDQKEYYTCVANWMSLYGLPINCENPDQMSAVLECMASEGYRQVSPAVFEVSMKIRYAFDMDSSSMYDRIREGIVFDLGRIFGMQMNDVTQSLFRHKVRDNQNWLASTVSQKLQLETYCKNISKQLING